MQNLKIKSILLDTQSFCRVARFWTQEIVKKLKFGSSNFCEFQK